MMLEALVHDKACFITLTYRDDELPDAGSLCPLHVTNFLKRYRKGLNEAGYGPIRYFMVGEYGDESERPHYHAAIFGADGSEAYYDSDGRIVNILDKTWGHGFTQYGTLTFESAAYIAGYVTKKMTSKNDERLAGRYPEFARMSLKPGIGALSTHQIFEVVSSPAYERELQQRGIPSALQHGRRTMPLGRYIVGKLRDALGDIKCGDNKDEVFKKSAEMLVMYERYLNGEEAHPPWYQANEKKEQRRLNIETKHKIYQSGKGKL